MVKRQNHHFDARDTSCPSPCFFADGTSNCCTAAEVCIPRGDYQGLCTTISYQYQLCLSSPPLSTEAFICPDAPAYRSVTCCTKSSDTCTVDGCAESFPGLPYCGYYSTSCFDNANNETCCGLNRKCIESGPEKGACVPYPPDDGTGPCDEELGRQPCGDTCCRPNQVTGNQLVCANQELGLCCERDENDANGECCPTIQRNLKGECCKGGTLAWGDACLPRRVPVGNETTRATPISPVLTSRPTGKGDESTNTTVSLLSFTRAGSAYLDQKHTNVAGNLTGTASPTASGGRTVVNNTRSVLIFTGGAGMVSSPLRGVIGTLAVWGLFGSFNYI